MSLLEFIGFFGAFMVGLIMGLTGSGGSVLSVPILAYLFNYNEKVATAYSLFIVGATALIGSFRAFRENKISKGLVLYFGVPAIVGVVLVRRLILHWLPDVLFSFGTFDFTRRMLVFGLFGILTAYTGYSMLAKSKINLAEFRSSNLHLKSWLPIAGVLLGMFVGLIGAGGGFLIVPMMMSIAKISFKKAVATSLVIVCLNSLVGFFLGDFVHLEINWSFLLTFVMLSFLGILIGGTLVRYIDGERLKKGFAYFLLFMSLCILIIEFKYH